MEVVANSNIDAQCVTSFDMAHIYVEKLIILGVQMGIIILGMMTTVLEEAVAKVGMRTLIPTITMEVYTIRKNMKIKRVTITHIINKINKLRKPKK